MKCPHCEKEIALTPLEDLKTHIKKKIRLDTELLERRKEFHPDSKKTKTMYKWESWLKAIEELEAK